MDSGLTKNEIFKLLEMDERSQRVYLIQWGVSSGSNWSYLFGNTWRQESLEEMAFRLRDKFLEKCTVEEWDYGLAALIEEQQLRLAPSALKPIHWIVRYLHAEVSRSESK